MNGYKHRIVVPFQDTDMAGVVHYTKLLGYVEQAEHAALESVDVPVISSKGGFPKVHIECDYRAPVRFGDEVDVVITLREISDKSLHWGYLLELGGRSLAGGTMVTAMVDIEGKPKVIPLDYRDKLRLLCKE